MAQIITQLPDVGSIDSYLPSEATIIYSDDNEILSKIHEEENRQVVPLSKISPYLIKAVISTEDRNFYFHHGIDFGRTIRAAGKNILTGRIVEGGSTITQQLARNLFLTKKKSFFRKAAEAILAMQIERRFSKEEILELYLNQIYWGHNSYGIESAAYLYFGKEAGELDLAEASLLAGMIEAPELLSPYKNFELSKKRQKKVLINMIKYGGVSIEEAKAAFAKELVLFPDRVKRKGQIAPYFVSHVVQYLSDKYGAEMVYKGGLKVYTTLSASMEKAAEETIKKFVTEEGSKYNFSQAALLSIDPRNGYIKAMVGGADFYKSQFNRAVQSRRPPGSSFKPFVYAAAVEKGYSPGTILSDKKTTFQVFPNKWNPEGTWTPYNFDKKFHGNVTMRHALEQSLNIPSIKLLEQVGIDSAINMARRMGIKGEMEYALALTLGVYDVTLMEMTSSYGVFANNGIRVEPIAILKVVSRDGVILEENKPQETQVMDKNTAYVMVDMMKGVLQRGTGFKGKIGREAAAKTGTTEQFRDAWFIGFVPQNVTGVWVGNDDNRSMKGVAEVSVCPRLWKDYMQKALANEPEIKFPRPEGMVKVQICRDSGLRPSPNCPSNRLIWVDFLKNDVPMSQCHIHGGKVEEEGEEETTPPEWLQEEEKIE